MKIIEQVNKILQFFKKPSEIDSFKNILVVSNTGLGDTLLSTPSIVSLRKSFPEISLTFLINKKMFPLFDGFEFIDDFILYSSGFLNQFKINIVHLSQRYVLLIIFYRIYSLKI